MKLALVLGFAACATVVALSIALAGPDGAPDSVEPGRGDALARSQSLATQLVAGDSASVRTTQVASRIAPSDAAPPEPARGRLAVASPGDAEHRRVDAPETGAVEVRVLLADARAPVPGATVTIGSREALTDAAGLASLPLVPTGPAAVRVRSEGFDEHVQHVHVVTGWNERVDVELERKHVLEVRAVDARGRPFDVAACGLARAEASRIGLVVAGSCGAVGREFTAFDAPSHRSRVLQESGGMAWSVELQRASAGCAQVVLGSTIVGAQSFARGAAEVSVVVDEATLRDLLTPIEILVVDAERGFPLAGVHVVVVHGTGRPTVLATDGSGRARLETLHLGGARVVARSPGHAPGEATVPRPLDGPVTVRLSPGRRIVGVVLDPEGRPLAGVRVILGDESKLPGPDGRSERPSARTERDGTFEIRDVAPIQHALAVTSAPRTRRLDATSKADCRFGDATGIVLRCTAPAGQPGSAAGAGVPR